MDSCDVLVVGGGIHGVGVAQAAAAAGHEVIVLEKTALAAGTSSKSSKLIHGGLRYLESREFSLVRESLRERELLIRLAPTLVHRCSFHVPIYKSTSRGPWLMRLGLSCYSVLAGLDRNTLFKQVPRSEWDSLDGLLTADLRCVFRYVDAQTDDRLLTQAVMRSAESLGAELLCPARFVAANIGNDGCESTIELAGQERLIKSCVIVNAAGPWANHVLQRITPVQKEFPVDHVQGAHIELPGKVRNGCYYLEVPRDRRAVFAMPWKNDRTLLGTTEHIFTGDPSQVHALDHEVDYLLDVYQKFFPQRPTEVLDKWAGLRVLPAAQGGTFKRSRETQLPVNSPSRPQLLSIFGGKLTGYRATALKVMRKLAPTLPPCTRKAHTHELVLE